MSRISRLFESLSKEINCVLISSDINRRYFTGMKSSAGYVLAFREKSYLLIDFRYFEKAQKTVTSSQVILLTNLKTQALELLKKHGVSRLSIESEFVTLEQFSRLDMLFDGIEIDFSNKLSEQILNLRTIKSQKEIEKIKSAQKIAENAFSHILNFIKPGITERQIALELDFFMLKNGAEALSFETIALTGANTSLPHGVPDGTEVKNGSFVLMDFGAVYDGYHSDMTRTICVGEPTEKMSRIYDIVLNAQLAAIAKAQAGISGGELDAFARKLISEAGYGENFGHSLGHGVGLEIHEGPTASISAKIILKENMVVTIEPGIYLTGEFGVRIEDFVVIKDGFCDNITNCPKNLLCL